MILLNKEHFDRYTSKHELTVCKHYFRDEYPLPFEIITHDKNNELSFDYFGTIPINFPEGYLGNDEIYNLIFKSEDLTAYIDKLTELRDKLIEIGD